MNMLHKKESSLTKLSKCLWICYIRRNLVWLSGINVYEYVTSEGI
jgi:hypothetical protein